ncbi:MAG: ABC transporter substrate-binding protein [Clostridiales bacterium]|nr:ABC transporter substrate-binding protein [Clostridiales bacterium]
MKKIFFFCSVVLLSILGAACAATSASVPVGVQKEILQLDIAVLRGPGGIGSVWLMEEAVNVQKNYTFHLADSPEQVVAWLANGTVKMAALPSNLAANLYEKTKGQIRMTAIITRGMLYLLQAGDEIKSWPELAGHIIYATGRGSNPEYILLHLLKAHGFAVGENIDVVFENDHTELATMLAIGKVDLAMLPEPFVTSVMAKNTAVSTLFDLSAEWEALGTGSLAMTALVSSADFITDHPQAVEQFLSDMKTSINFAVNNVAKAATLCEKFDIIPTAAVAELAIPRCNLTFITGQEMKEAITAYYEVLYAANPQSIGGVMPEEGFYY